MADDVKYQFLPWVREGLAAQLPTRDTLGAGVRGRARLEVNVSIARRAGAPIPVTQKIEVSGPGDVVGIDRRQVIRTDPKPNANDFEPNFLVLVEFDRPDFPWLFTPATADTENRLRPWVVLVVVTRTEGVSLSAQAGRPLPVLTIEPSAKPSRQLPDLTDSWAWAHGQVVLAGAERLEDVLAQRPERTGSRLICPRRLDPNTGYHACVVPVFEAGRRAGLALPPEAADETSVRPAWTAGSDVQTVLPVYFSWDFATGGGGDFESLARLLRARPIPPEVGRHQVFFGAAGPPLPALPPESRGAVVPLRGALVPPEQPAQPWPPETRAQVEEGLRGFLDLPAQRLGVGGTAAAGPAVTPPLYGRWLAAQPTVPSPAAGPRWMRTLNLDPRHRAVGGLATRVVQQEQERLMDQAWAQVGEIERANRELRWAQLAAQVRTSLLRRHVAPLADGRLLQITQAAHRRMLVGPATLAATARASAFPEAALSAPFRRTVRPRGALARRAYAPPERTIRPFVEGLDARKLVPAPPERPPDGLFGFRATAPARPGVAPTVVSLIAAAAPAATTRPPRVTSAPAVRSVVISDTLARRVAERMTGGTTPVISIKPPPIVTPPGGTSARPIAPVGPPPIDRLPGTPPPINLPPVLDPNLPPVVLDQVRTVATEFKETTALTVERIDDVAVQPAEPVRPPLAVAGLRAQVLARLDPARTIQTRVQRRITIPPHLRPIPTRDPLDEVLAGPNFPQPGWELLRDWFPEHLLPGLEHVPANTVSLMQTNPPFVEAFLVGLNHELGRELLWREFPASQRATGFRRFWAPGGRDDIPPVHTWNRTSDLGSTLVGGLQGQLVLLVRGDLLRRYPSTVIYAAPDLNGRPRLENDAVKTPLFRGRLDPDVTFAGFDLTPDEARKRWWFIFEEQPTEPRFALDAPDGFGDDAPPLNQWNDLSWGHLAVNADALAALSHIRLAGFTAEQPPAPLPRWGSSASAMAAILVQQPVRVSLRGADLLQVPPPTPPPS